MIRLFRPFFFLKLIYPGALFRLNSDKKDLLLTFDDGPSPESTMSIMDVLDRYDVKAVFFCTGEEAEKFPELIRLAILRGHTIGNHGYHHLNGWKTNPIRYVQNVFKAAEFTSTTLFRPPYGRISPSQYRRLIRSYRIIMWDVMSYDFEPKISSRRVLEILKKKIRPGSVIVLHDKPSSSVLPILDEFIKYALDEGYNFMKLPTSSQK